MNATKTREVALRQKIRDLEGDLEAVRLEKGVLKETEKGLLERCDFWMKKALQAARRFRLYRTKHKR